MTNCPECKSENVELMNDHDEYREADEFFCWKCGCEFSVKYVTKAIVKISKHGGGVKVADRS